MTKERDKQAKHTRTRTHVALTATYPEGGDHVLKRSATEQAMPNKSHQLRTKIATHAKDKQSFNLQAKSAGRISFHKHDNSDHQSQHTFASRPQRQDGKARRGRVRTSCKLSYLLTQDFGTRQRYHPYQPVESVIHQDWELIRATQDCVDLGVCLLCLCRKLDPLVYTLASIYTVLFRGTTRVNTSVKPTQRVRVRALRSSS